MVKGATSALVIRGMGAALMFATQVIIARLLGSTEYGYFVYATSWLALLAIFAKFGFDNSLPRFIPEYQVLGKTELLHGLLGYSSRFVGLVGLGFGLAFAAAVVFAGFFAPVLRGALVLMAVALPFYSLTHIRQAGLRAHKFILLSELPEGIVRPLVLCLLIFGAHTVLTNVLAWHAWLCHLAAILAALAAGSFWHRRKIPPRSGRQTEPRAWLSVSFPLFLIEGMNVLMNNFAMLLIGFFVPPAEVALLGVLMRIMILVSFAQMAVNTIAAPMISELFFAKKMAELQDALNVAAKGIFVFTIFIDVMLIFFGKFVLGLFGDEYVSGYIFLLVLLAAATIKALSGAATYVLNMTGHHRLTTRLMVWNLGFTVTLNAIMVPLWSLWGAVLANALTMIVWNVTLVYFCVRTVRLNTTVFLFFNSHKMLK